MKVITDIDPKVYQSIKSGFYTSVDRYIALDSICYGIPIPDNVTNGNIIEAMFPNVPVLIFEDMDTVLFGNAQFDLNWWKASYKE